MKYSVCYAKRLWASLYLSCTSLALFYIRILLTLNSALALDYLIPETCMDFMVKIKGINHTIFAIYRTGNMSILQ